MRLMCILSSVIISANNKVDSFFVQCITLSFYARAGLKRNKNVRNSASCYEEVSFLCRYVYSDKKQLKTLKVLLKIELSG